MHEVVPFPQFRPEPDPPPPFWLLFVSWPLVGFAAICSLFMPPLPPRPKRDRF